MLTLPWSFPIPSPNFDFGKSSLTDFNFYLKTKKILVWFNSFFSVLFVFSIHSNTNKDICTMHIMPHWHITYLHTALRHRRLCQAPLLHLSARLQLSPFLQLVKSHTALLSHLTSSRLAVMHRLLLSHGELCELRWQSRSIVTFTKNRRIQQGFV